MILNKDKLAEHIVSLNDAASPSSQGVVRDAFARFLSNLRASESVPTPLLTFPFGSTNVVVNHDGSVLSEPSRSGVKSDVTDDVKTADVKAYKRLSTKPGWHVKPNTAPAGSAPTNKMLGKIRIPAGLCLIVGAADAGKTPLAHALAGEGGGEYAVVRFGEPLSGYDLDETEAALSLVGAMLDGYDVVLDSVKDVLSLMGGAAMKSGLAREVLPMFSRWSTLAADMGVTLYVPVNPSSPDDEVVDLLVEATKSNATMTVFGEGGDKWAFVARRGEGLMREKGDFSAAYDKRGIVTLAVGSTASAKGKEYASETKIGSNISDAQFAASIRRSIHAVAYQ